MENYDWMMQDDDDLEYPRKYWSKLLSESVLDRWDAGDDCNHMIQPGKFHGTPFEIEYEFDGDEEIPHDADDDFWLSHVISMRRIREEDEE